MPSRPVPGIEVVKVQQALYPPGGDALIYDQDRKRLQQHPLTASERHMMGRGGVRVFPGIVEHQQQVLDAARTGCGWELVTDPPAKAGVFSRRAS